MIRKQTLIAAAALVAVTGALLAPNGALAANYSPTGAVTNAQNGTILYFVSSAPDMPTEQPHVDGWATDLDAGVSPIDVIVDVTWYRTACFRSCFSLQVGQTSLSQTASLPEAVTAGTSYGPNHGFSINLPWFLGSYDREQACVTAINAGLLGTSTSLGCYDVRSYGLK